MQTATFYQSIEYVYITNFKSQTSAVDNDCDSVSTSDIERTSPSLCDILHSDSIMFVNSKNSKLHPQSRKIKKVVQTAVNWYLLDVILIKGIHDVDNNRFYALIESLMLTIEKCEDNALLAQILSGSSDTFNDMLKLISCNICQF